jgi:RHS repeat-associated protein
LFAYDTQGHLLGEYDGTGQLIQEIVWFGDLPIAVLKPAVPPGTGIDVFYVHADHLGTPRQLSRPGDNQVLWSWEGEAFGNTPPNPNPTGQGEFVFNLRFPGQYADTETGLHYNYFRNYDPATGRYIESDPIGLAGGINTYGYVNGDPLKYIDPLGLFGQSVEGGFSCLSCHNGWLTGYYQKEYPNTGDLQKDIERGANNEEYKRVCDEPPPPDLTDPCERAKWELNKAKRCKAAREENTRRWWGGVDNRHSPQLFDDIDRAIQAAEDAIKRHCKCK